MIYLTLWVKEESQPSQGFVKSADKTIIRGNQQDQAGFVQGRVLLMAGSLRDQTRSVKTVGSFLGRFSTHYKDSVAVSVIGKVGSFHAKPHKVMCLSIIGNTQIEKVVRFLNTVSLWKNILVASLKGMKPYTILMERKTITELKTYNYAQAIMELAHRLYVATVTPLTLSLYKYNQINSGG